MTKTVRITETSESRQVPRKARCVSIPRDMNPEGGTAELVSDDHGTPVFRYQRMDGVEATVQLRTMPIGERNAGDELLLETEEVDDRGFRRWRQAIVRP